MAEVKWSAKATKAAPVAADHTLIVDAADGASKYVPLSGWPLTGNRELVALGTGLLKNTTTSGTPSIATPWTDYALGVLDPTTLANAAWAGETETVTAGENLAKYDLCYLKSDGKYWKAKGDAAGTMPAVAMATAAITAAATGVVLKRGIIRYDTWGFTTNGAFLYPSAATAGAITATPPAANGNQVQRIAQVTQTDNVIYLPFDMTVVEVATGTVAVAAGKTVTIDNTMTIAGADDTAAPTFPAGADTVVELAVTQTLTNKRVTPRVVSIPYNDGTLTTGNTEYNIDNADEFVILTGLAQDTNFGVPNGTPVDGQKLIIRILCDGTLRNLTWTGTAGGWVSRGVTLPATAAASKYLYIGFIYNGVAGVWDCVASAQEA